MAGTAVVAAWPVVAGVVVVGAAVVVALGAAVSELPPQAEATNKNTSATAYFLIAPVCHPTPEGGVGVSDALGVDTRKQDLP